MTLPRAVLVGFALAALVGPARAGDGDPDPTFNEDGRAWHIWPDTFVQAETTAVAALRDGSIVTAGWVDRGDNNRDFALAKFRADGTLDDAFGNQGAQVIAFDLTPGADDRALSVFATPDNKLMVLGWAGIEGQPYQHPALLRLDANGQPDASFGSGGKRVITTHPWGDGFKLGLTSAARTSDGKLLLAGDCGNCGNGGGLGDFVVLRMSADGTPDASFGNAGWASFGRIAPDQHYFVERVNAVAADRQGRVVLAGITETYQDPDEQQRPTLLRFTAQGQLDTGFAGVGFLEMNMLGSWSAAALALDPVNDSLVVALNVTNMPAVVPATLLMRVRSTGVVDTTFGEDGFVDLTRAEGSNVSALAIRHDRRITAAGWVDPNGAAESYFLAARTLSDGTLDTDFDGNGARQIAMPIDTNTHARAYAIALSGERPVIAGSLYDGIGAQFASGVLRLQSDAIFADGLD